MAPETLRRNRWSQQSDVYSFGVLVWELLSGGDVPWGIGMSNADVQARVTSGERLAYYPSWPRSLVDMMTRCFSAAADTRPSFSDLKTELMGLLVSGPLVLPEQNDNEELLIDDITVESARLTVAAISTVSPQLNQVIDNICW